VREFKKNENELIEFIKKDRKEKELKRKL